MTSTETGLRLMAVAGIYGDAMLDAFRALKTSPSIETSDLTQAGLSVRQASQFLAVSDAELETSLQWLEHPDHHLITADNDVYPEALRAIVDYPALLFVAGDPALLRSTQLAVVGSRAHSWYGERWGSYFCEALAKHGLTITSGLALGIDGVAHRAALKAEGKTIAVLGHGLSLIHPRRHLQLAKQILETGGALVSEFPLMTKPLAHHFPRRNRVISGLSQGVFVVEAALKSGSLVTARCALEQGREVFALPGPVGHPGTEGPHWLIRQGAILVNSPEEILENLQYGFHWLPDDAEKTNYSPDHQSVALPFPELLANVGDEVTPVDVVAERAGQPVPVTVAQLLELELAGWIAAVPGGYVRLRRACHVRRTNVFV
ncbi:DNA-protecting protein DprA [Trabulsiella odontotermitis]|uniref:DNA processing protein DprA n=1 Tax=Trabulsiella odontotermitis TaxID=379893 RepID=A0A0L0GLG3_9ENTR|nr:DNA-protecting protein DprA [Trabulsiella odontotermitis]KNC89571.1 DNA processing protein DprA [Trabulsiella odontotermitis]